MNLRGAFLCAREAIKGFLGDEKPGVVINVSSVHQTTTRDGSAWLVGTRDSAEWAYGCECRLRAGHSPYDPFSSRLS